MAGAEAGAEAAAREWTYEALVAAGLDPEDYEVEDGALVAVPAMSREGSTVRGELIRLLGNRLAELGRPAHLHDSGRFRLAEEPRRERQPDVALVLRERAPPRGSAEDRWPMAVAPDLAIEVLSPSDSVASLKRKLERDYFGAGTREAWVVDPDLQTISVLRPGEPTRSHDRRHVLESAVVPGLRLSLEELFSVLD